MRVAKTNLVRLLNKTSITDDLDWPGYESLVKLFLAVDLLAGPGTSQVADRGPGLGRAAQQGTRAKH